MFKALHAFAEVKYRIPPKNISKLLQYSGIRGRPKRKTTVIPFPDLKPWFVAVQGLNKTRLQETSRDILLLCLFLGLRRMEAMSLRWADVDLKRKTLTVRNTKNHTDHTLPISSYIHSLLKNRRAQASQQSPHVFPGKDGIRAIRDIDEAVHAVVKASGVSFTLHDLRRTFATLATELGIPPYTLKRLLNHRSEQDVTEGYVILTVDSLRKPVGVLSDRILKLAKISPVPAVYSEDENTARLS